MNAELHVPKPAADLTRGREAVPLSVAAQQMRTMAGRSRPVRPAP